MKKTLFLILAAVAPAMAGETQPVTVYTPTPAPAACPLTLEIGGTYRYAVKECINVGPAKEIDMYGPEITAVYSLTPEHAITLRFGYNYGSEAIRYASEAVYEYEGPNDYPIQPMATATEGDVTGGDNDYDVYNGTDYENTTVRVNSFYLMPGYRYTTKVNDNLAVYVGASVGITNMSVKYRSFSWTDFGGGDTGEEDLLKTHGSDWGVAGSLELGLQYKVSDSAYLYAAYELYGSTAEPTFHGGEGVGADTQVYHSIRAGVGFSF